MNHQFRAETFGYQPLSMMFPGSFSCWTRMGNSAQGPIAQRKNYFG